MSRKSIIFALSNNFSLYRRFEDMNKRELRKKTLSCVDDAGKWLKTYVNRALKHQDNFIDDLSKVDDNYVLPKQIILAALHKLERDYVNPYPKQPRKEKQLVDKIEYNMLDFGD